MCGRGCCVATAGGHLGATVLHEDGTVDYTVLYSFSDRAALDAWLDSPSRRRFAAQAEPFSVAHYESPRITGLETWFMLPHERRVGLNHLALDVVGVEALHSWETTLDASTWSGPQSSSRHSAGTSTCGLLTTSRSSCSR